jgi:hypothetical protein
VLVEHDAVAVLIDGEGEPGGRRRRTVIHALEPPRAAPQNDGPRSSARCITLTSTHLPTRRGKNDFRRDLSRHGSPHCQKLCEDQGGLHRRGGGLPRWGSGGPQARLNRMAYPHGIPSRPALRAELGEVRTRPHPRRRTERAGSASPACDDGRRFETHAAFLDRQ